MTEEKRRIPLKDVGREELPEWALCKFCATPAKFYWRSDGALMVNCSQLPLDLNIWVWRQAGKNKCKFLESAGVAKHG